MSDPVDYARSYSFTGYQANNPSRPLPGQQVDAELENVAEAIRQTNDALGEVRRADGKLANNVVTVGSLTADVTALMTGGAVSAWATPVAWAPGLVAQIAAPATTCTYNGETYLAAVAHTAGAVFESANWIKLAAKGTAGSGIGDMLAANNLSDLTDLAQARANLGVNNAANLSAGTLASARLPASLAAVHGLLPAANKAPYYTSASAADLYDLTAFGRSFLGSADASVGRSVLGLGSAAVLAGGVAANNLLQLDGSGRIPAVSGALLTNLPIVNNRVYAETRLVNSVTAITPFDDTIPQITEGASILTATFTPRSAASRVVVRYKLNVGADTVVQAIVHLHWNGGADAVAVDYATPSGNSYGEQIIGHFEHVPGASTTQTYEVRLGSNSGARLTLNGYNGNRLFGGRQAATIEIYEV